MLIAIERADGGVSIMRVKEGRSVEACLEDWAKAAPAAYVSHREISESDIPADRSFRDAWRPDLSHDMTKARDILRDRLREVRTPKLAALDVAYQRADEVGDADAKIEVARQKQVLRDLPQMPAIDEAKTVDDLRAIDPLAVTAAAAKL